MKSLALFGIFVLLIAALLSADQYAWFQKPRDMENVRQQFHLPDDALFVHFDSNPKSFRPEGLKSEAVIQFSEKAFADYLAQLDSSRVWKPTPLLSYSPAVGEDYSAFSLKWLDLPLSEEVTEFAERTGLDLPEAARSRSGKYYCSILEYQQTGRWEHNPDAFKYKVVGRSCAELEADLWPVVTIFGAIDTDARRLHVALKFSG